MEVRSAELVAAVLAVVKVGAGYVPLDPSLPDDRLSLITDDTGVTVVLSRADLAHQLPPRLRSGDSLVVTSLDGGNDATELPVAHDGDADGVAYVIYTSGSTGRPKGAVVPHRAVTRLVVNTDYCTLGPSDAVAFASNFSFDAATFEIWAALLSGSRLVPVATETLLDPRRLAAELRRWSITTMFVTTALFNEIAAQAPDAFASLRTVLFGGERADPRRVRDVLLARPPERLLHVYGPTETTTFASWHLVTDVAEGASNLSIGRPIANTELLVVDRDLRLVPPGVVGELCIGGLGLAHGYLGDPDLTARRFVGHPYRPGARLYRSGDLAVQRSDGTVELCGRIDTQVKIRGFRIEPGEVEAHLLDHPVVATAVVVARQDRPGAHQLAAYVVLEAEAAGGGTPVTPAELRAFLQQRLPDHLVPGTVTVLGALPLTPNGKIDRAGLPVPVPEPADKSRPPVGPTEVALSRIWAEVLTLDPAQISSEHSFFELGGHSLLLTSVASLIRDRLGAELPLRVLFDRPTIAGLAAAVDACERESTPPIPKADRPAHRATVNAHGHLELPGALRERLRAMP